jgi:hypothetical protein
MPRKIGGIASGQGFAVSGMASAEGPVDNNIDSTQPAESSANLSHGKKVYIDYSVTGESENDSFLLKKKVNYTQHSTTCMVVSL